MSTEFAGYRRGSSEYRRLLIAMFAAGLATFAQLYSPQPLLPAIAEDLGVSADTAALTMSCATAGLALCTLLWASVADHCGRVRTMTVAVLGATCFGLLTPWVSHYPLMLLLRTVEGAFLGGVAGLAVAVIVSEAHPSVRTAATGLYISGTSIGGLAGRIIAGPLSEVMSWRLSMFAVSVVGALAAVLFITLIPASHDRQRTPGASIGSSGVGSALGFFHKIKGLLTNMQVLALFFAGFALMGALVSIYNYIGFKLQAPPYFLSPTLIAFLFLMYLFGTVSSGAASRLTGKHGLKPVFLTSCLLMAAGILLTLAGPLPVVVLGLAVLTTGFFAAHAIASGWVGLLSLDAKTQATALYNSFYYTGSALVGWATGLLYTAAGWSGTALACTGLLLLSALFSALALGKKAG